MSFNSKYTGAQVEAWLDNIKNYSANDILTKLKTVDGSDSGLDADLLDGKHNGELTAQYFSRGKILTSSDTINTLMSGVYCYIHGNNPTGSVGDNTILLSFRNDGRTDMFQLANSANEHLLYYRSAANIGNSYENWSNWRTFAFTDSNVASATKATQDNEGRAISSTYFRYRGELYGSALSQTACGFWTTYAFSQDLPSAALTKYGILVVFAASSTFKSALWLNSSGELYMYTVVDSAKTGWIKVK